MNVFEKSLEAVKSIESRKQGSRFARPEKISVPHFVGYYREKKPSYTIEGNAVVLKKTAKFAQKTKIDKVLEPVEIPVRRLQGAFICSRILAHTFCQLAYHNADLHEQGKELVPLNTSLVALIASDEGFVDSDYSQGSVKGASRIRKHILDHVAKNPDLKITVSDTGIIEGLTYDVCRDMIEAT